MQTTNIQSGKNIWFRSSTSAVLCVFSALSVVKKRHEETYFQIKEWKSFVGLANPLNSTYFTT
jgi:hypothetical protein